MGTCAGTITCVCVCVCAHACIVCKQKKNVIISSSQFSPSFFLPCRFATDLVLWQPASPAFVEKANAKSMLISCMDVLQPAATKEDRFEMCKSVLKEGQLFQFCPVLRSTGM